MCLGSAAAVVVTSSVLRMFCTMMSELQPMSTSTSDCTHIVVQQ